MSGQPAGQLTNAGTGTVSVTSDVATVRPKDSPRVLLEIARASRVKAGMVLTLLCDIQVSISVSSTRPTAKAAREDAAVSASAVIAAVQQVSAYSCWPAFHSLFFEQR